VPRKPAKPQPFTWPAIPWDYVAAFVSLVVIAWLITLGDWNFFPSAGFLESFYDAQAESLLHGRIDVPRDAIAPEAFVRDGKSYGYFGPTPALARLPLNLLIQGMEGRWNRLSMLLASALAIGMLVLLLRRLEERFPSPHPKLRSALGALLIFSAALGSTNFFVSAEAKVYQESIAWGSALAFAHVVFLFCNLTRPSPRWLALTCISAFLAFFARVSSGAGPIAALFLLDVALMAPLPRLRQFLGIEDPKTLRGAKAAFTATIAATVILWGALNYWKFGTVFTSQPMAMNIQYDAARMQRIKGSLFSLSNVPVMAWAYLSPGNIVFLKHFPWIDFVQLGRDSVAARFPDSHLDSVEPFASLPAAMPALLLAALVGTALCFSRRKELTAMRAPLLGALAGCGLIFTWGLVTYRYLHDMFPWLAAGSAILVAYIPSIAANRLRYAAAVLFSLTAAYTIGVNLWFGVLQQRWYTIPTPPEKRLAFVDVGREVDQAGLSGLLFAIGHWRGYIPGAAFSSGNLTADLQFAERPDHPVAYAPGPPPYAAEYFIDLPADGTYDLSIRYASPDARPVRLFLNGQELGSACGLPTGGSSGRYQRWLSAGLFHVKQGRVRVGLASPVAFPYISMLRFVRVD
jgi:hypothetical protein